MKQRWVDQILLKYIVSLGKQVGVAAKVLELQSEKFLQYGFTTPCYAVFFSIIEENTQLESVVSSAEEDIREWRNNQPQKQIDLNLVLVSHSKQPSSAVAQIVRDPNLCRKFVLTASDENMLNQQLTFLPFGSLDIQEANKLRILSLSPVNLLMQSGATESFATDLVANRPGVQSLAESIVNREVTARAASKEQGIKSELEKDSSGDVAQSPSGEGRIMCGLGIEGFRGIGGKLTLIIAPSVTVIYGKNGTGKTTICDAIEWSVTGKLKRLEKDADASSDEQAGSIINFFSSEQRANVRISFNNPSHYVNRSIEGSFESDVTTDQDNSNWGAIQAATGSERRLGLDLRLAREAFRTSHLLEQSTIRDFLNTDPHKRFEALNRILGYDEFVRINRKLNSVCSHLNEHIYSMGPEEAEAKQRLSEVENQAAAISELIRKKDENLGAEQPIENLVEDLLRGANSFGLDTQKVPTSMGAIAIQGWAQERVKELDAFAVASSKNMAEATECVESLRCLSIELQDINGLRAQVEAGNSELRKLEKVKTSLEGSIEQGAKKERQLDAELKSLKYDAELLAWALKVASEIKAHEVSLTGYDREIKELGKFIASTQEQIGKIKSLQPTTVKAINDKKRKVESAVTRRHLIKDIAQSVAEWTSVVASIRTHTDEDKVASKRIAEIGREVQELQGNLVELKNLLQPAEKRLAREQNRYSRRSQLLLSLRQTLTDTDSSCPLCGSVYDTHEDLLVHITDAGEVLPASLKDLITEVESGRTEAATAVDAINDKTELIQKLRKRKELATQRLNAEKVRLAEIRNKAVQLEIIPAEADESYVIEDKVLHSLLSEGELPRIKRELSSLEKTHEGAELQLAMLGKTLSETVENRESISQKERNVADTLESLRLEVSERGASKLLHQSRDEVKSRLETKREAIDVQSHILTSVRDQTEVVSREKIECMQKIVHTKKSIEDVQTKLRGLLQKESELKSEFARLGYQGQLSYEDAQEFISELQGILHDVGDLQAKGSVLLELLNVESLREQLLQIGQSIEEQKEFNKQLEEEVRKRKAFRADAQDILEKFRRLTVNSMAETLSALSGPLNGIFERLNGHPLFGALRILPDEESKTVTFRVETNRHIGKDKQPGAIQDLPPRSYLSDAQLNIVALSIFMAIALYQTWSKFKLIVIDDPVQQLDDLNAASFLELVREISTQNQRQFLITTCNADFYKLALSKLSCMNTQEQTCFRAYRLEGLHPEGPDVILDAPYWENAVVKTAG